MTPREALQNKLGPAFEPLESSIIEVDDPTSVRGIYQMLIRRPDAADLKTSDIVFVDEMDHEFILQERTASEFVLFLLDGPQVDINRVLLRILSAGGQVRNLNITGLVWSEELRILIYQPAVPVDFEYRFRLEELVEETTDVSA